MKHRFNAKLEAALNQIESAFPVKKTMTIYDSAKRYVPRTAEDDLNADHERVESHLSKFI